MDLHFDRFRTRRCGTIALMLAVAGWVCSPAPAQIIGVSGPRLSSGSSLYAQAQDLFRRGQYEAALEQCDAAAAAAEVTGLKNRIRATAARCCLRLNRRAEVVRRLEEIERDDRASSWLALLPLVWNEKLPESERYVAAPTDLQAPSAVRRLAAASALLHETAYRDDCERILREFYLAGRLPFSMMAETQLWRLAADDAEAASLATVRRWQSRLAELPPTMRGGPTYLTGRALRIRHHSAEAVPLLLWLPLTEHDDRFLAAASLAESIRCLRDSGCLAEAGLLEKELAERFGETSAAQRSDGDFP